eukprot:TRINITY_DN2920_c0_g2_i1.p1 TRINITY_DN2920_c0_g2~~TRINITY_DN2920_c0_g2_i1.p1  ORF type:complete len:360 (+),score=76.45 TRINITY_DN2920_c0_g2_i1:522-1601(+)
MPHPSLDTFFFWNSGAEAVEASIKLARQATGRPNVIVMQGGFHGRTMGTMAMTRSKTIYSEGFGPFMSGVFSVPFPDCHHCPISGCSSSPRYGFHEGCCMEPVRQLELLLKQQTAPHDTAAIIIEPVLGEGGYLPAPKGYLEKVSEICKREGILLILDEVQSGFGRTGKYFAVEHYKPVVPDIMVMAKGIANGFPLSGIVSRKELMDKQKPGSMGGTYAGNAVACAAAVAVADAFKEERILENVERQSRILVDTLTDLKRSSATSHLVSDVRGLGLMQAIEFHPLVKFASSSKSSSSPSLTTPIGSRIQKKCIDKGMLVLTTSIYDVMRFIPPLNISEEEMKEGCKIIKESVEEVAKEL